jgi:hypothetical protein
MNPIKIDPTMAWGLQLKRDMERELEEGRLKMQADAEKIARRKQKRAKADKAA